VAAYSDRMAYYGKSCDGDVDSVEAAYSLRDDDDEVSPLGYRR
jgi:hypothetical protein